MTNRENITSLIKRTGYEFVPTFYLLCDYLQQTYGARIEAFEQAHNIPKCFAFSRGIAFEIADDRLRASYFDPPLKPDSFIDITGIGHEKGSAAAMHMTYLRSPLEHMETLEELKAYPYSNPIWDDAHLQTVQAENAALKAQDKLVFGRMGETIWERSWELRNMEQLMVDMLTDEELASFVLDKLTNISISQAEFFAKAGCDILWVGDDVGMQHTTMMSEDLYVTWLKPRLSKVIAAAKAINPDIMVFYHSCGYVEPFIHHLIEAGVEILNPVQPECMDFETICKTYGDKVSFHGTIGTQTTMPFGTPEQVRAEVFRNLDIAGKHGGLLVAPTHLLEPEVPVENIEAYLLACHEYTPSR